MDKEEKEGIGVSRAHNALTAVLVSEVTMYTAVTMVDGSTCWYWSHGVDHPVDADPIENLMVTTRTTKEGLLTPKLESLKQWSHYHPQLLPEAKEEKGGIITSLHC